MPIKRFLPPGRFPSWDPRGWPEAQLDPPTLPLARVVGLDDPDERTPLYDALWAISGMSGRHALTPTGEVPVGKHFDENSDGLADHDQPAVTAGQEDHSDPWVFAGEDADAPGEMS